MRLILASQSPARRQILQSAGLSPEVLPANVDEDAILAEHAADDIPTRLVALAAAKAARVSAELDLAHTQTPTLVIGCDSMFWFAGRLLGKPHTPEVALERVLALRGESGDLYTGHALELYQPGEPVRRLSATAKSTVHFSLFTQAEAEAYVASGEPLVVAGSFTLDGRGGAFIRGIEGDPHNIVGLSLPLVHDLASRLGVFWPDLWQ